MSSWVRPLIWTWLSNDTYPPLLSIQNVWQSECECSLTLNCMLSRLRFIWNFLQIENSEILYFSSQLMPQRSLWGRGMQSNHFSFRIHNIINVKVRIQILDLKDVTNILTKRVVCSGRSNEWCYAIIWVIVRGWRKEEDFVVKVETKLRCTHPIIYKAHSFVWQTHPR